MARSVDLRLAIPVCVGWVVLACQILLGKSLGHSSWWPVMVIAGGLCALSIGFRFNATVLLSGFTTVALSLVYLVRMPSHQDVAPWDEVSHTQSMSPAWATQLRSQFVELTSNLPGFGGELLPGLAIGDTTRVSQSLDVAMKSVSLTHITAVSGANCAIVTGSVMVFASLLGAGRKIRLLCGITALVLFVILVTPQPSVVRAAVMASIVICALYIGRPSAGVPLLAVAVLVLLLWNPWWAIEFGFILSVSATAGLLLFSLPLAIKLAQWMPYWCALAIAVPLSAQLLCQPFIILLAPTLPTYGVLANIIAGPAAPLATILGLVACLIAIPLPWLAHVVMWCAWIPAQWIGSASQSISHFPYPSIPWVSGVLGATIAAALSILFLVALLTKTTWLRTSSIFILLTSMLSWLCVVAVGSLRDSARIPQGWAIAVCDVGQGDAILLASEKSIALIDTGPQPDRLERCLSRLRISRIDLLVLTHFDKDHVGGLEAVIGKVSHAIVGSPENFEDESLLEDLGSGGAELTKGEVGLHGTLGAAKWQVLWPDAHHPQMQLGNPGSVTLMVSFPGFTSLFLGDHGKESQLALMQTISLPHIDVVKVAHHGSADQSMTLYERIHPSVGLFSVGQENDYGHPRKEILDELHGLGALIPRTDEDGMIMVIPEPQGISVWTEH